MYKDSEKSIVYVLCPANLQAGGPDALHQMVFYLNSIGIKSKIVYMKDLLKKKISIPEKYKCYLENYILENDVIDSSSNVIIIPESYSKKRFTYKNCKKYIWWLGINNSLNWTIYKKICFFLALPLLMVRNWTYYKKNFFRKIEYVLFNSEAFPLGKESSDLIHLCASHFAYDYVSQKSRNKAFLCIEPISKFFLEEYFKEVKCISKKCRKNVILYNPQRNYTYIIKKILIIAPELQFEPLQGLTQQQLIDKYKSSKLYLDFGAFPGAERIPKEAVLYGCAIITGQRGCSGFYGDVPIPETYKFRNPEKQIDEIVEKIKSVLNNYENVYSDFDKYRNTVLKLEENFVKSLKKIFPRQI